MTKKDLKKKLQEKLEKKKKGLLGKKDGGFKSLSSTGVADSTASVAEEDDQLTEDKISSRTKKEIEKLRKKNLDDDEIMIELDKKLNLKQKEMNEVARFLLDIDK